MTVSIKPCPQPSHPSTVEVQTLREALRALSPHDPRWRAAYDRLALAGELMGDGSWRYEAAAMTWLPGDGVSGIR